MRVIRLLGWTLGSLIGAVALLIAGFFLAAWAGSSIPRNGGWSETETGIPIMVESNGVHTGIVMPIATPVKDWRETFPSTAEPMKSGMRPTHISVGWGDREVYRTVATWGDLKPATALRIATRGGPAVMRVATYYRPSEDTNHRWLILREQEYARLVARIEAGLPTIANPEDRISLTSFDPRARIYDSTGRYTPFYTCNQWVADALAAAGVEMGQWTPLAGGVMKWIPQGEAQP